MPLSMTALHYAASAMMEKEFVEVMRMRREPLEEEMWMSWDEFIPRRCWEELEEEMSRSREEQRLRQEKYLSRLQIVASRVQKVRSWFKKSSSRVKKSSSTLAKFILEIMESRSTELEREVEFVRSWFHLEIQQVTKLENLCSRLEKDLDLVIWHKQFLQPDILQHARRRSCDRTSTQMRPGQRRYKDPELGILRAMSIFGVSLGSGSMEYSELMKWPESILNKGPIKPSEPASDAETPPYEIRDQNEKLMNSLALQFTEHVKSALLPVLGPVAAALQEERKHQEKLLELEERQLALKMRLKRRGVGRSQRRRRASSAQRLGPRTRQLGPRLRFPWKR